jgi:hypothetical protein
VERISDAFIQGFLWAGTAPLTTTLRAASLLDFRESAIIGRRPRKAVARAGDQGRTRLPGLPMHAPPVPTAPARHRSRRTCLQSAAALLFSAHGGSVFAQSDDDTALTGPNMPYAAFDRLPVERIEVAGGAIRVGFGPGDFALPRERLMAYVRQSARSVVTYFGRFPARDTRLLILPTATPGRAVRSGSAFGGRGAAIKLTLAASVTEADLERDWILVHEMSHLALPSLPRRHHWLEEGMASYVEPLARAQAGVLAIPPIWGGIIAGMPQGLPQAGDRGLDNTPTWGRTYWGGALFCLLADVEIRERRAGSGGLQQALRAILERGNMETDSPIEPLLRIGDAAVGVPVLSELYARMKDAPFPVDLDALWRRLGVRVEGQDVRFDDAAPLAAVRRALTAPYAG